MQYVCEWPCSVVRKIKPSEVPKKKGVDVLCVCIYEYVMYEMRLKN
jgi:hypothetical protein